MIPKTLIFFFLLLIQANSILDHESWCEPKAGNYTSNSVFQSNLNTVLSSIASNSATSYFSNSTSGTGLDTIYALFSCRGDIDQADCYGCVNDAADEVQSECPTAKEAVYFSHQCTLRYANRNIFAEAEGEPHAWWCGGQVDSDDPREFSTRIKAEFGDFVEEVAYGNNNKSSLRFYEKKEVDVGVKATLLAQCTPDLTSSDCEACLRKTVRNYPTYCGVGNAWIIVRLASCQIEYQTGPSLVPPPSQKKKKDGDGDVNDVVVGVVVSIVVGIVVLVSLIIWMIRRYKVPTLSFLRRSFITIQRKSKVVVREGGGEEKHLHTTDCLNFDLQAIETATKGFSLSHKLGEGGFGIVYEGVLENGERVAVKRLSKISGQGSQEFKTEVAVVAKLQHKNLVRLVGFCVKGEERLLVYEFMPNLSLDRFLFDTTRSSSLTWPIRLKIISGVAKGLQYLHEDSRVTIVHRDLKTSNILLDEELEPKIADFGMARLVQLDQTSENTCRVVGTFGYMAPEYVLTGRISFKSDVYSFGVIVLEILSGKSNIQFYQMSRGEGLIRIGRRVWGEDAIEELMDPVLGNNFSRTEAQRCLQIGLLCVHEDESNRPSMNAVLLMLGSNTVELPIPMS